MSPQHSIAHYRIVSKIGEGGMGAVYRATDTKLQRDVAVKVLPEAFAKDADRMARFTREAQVLASLNHPNIAAVYGIEEGALVMELVEGEDLAGPLPVDVALRYARQISAGLEAAHEKGIIHRDLKPANIRITADGNVKILDFGLAKAAVTASPTSNASPTVSPTLPMSMTQSGMILGTAAYMSPEQARGKPVDRRADIWAFGVVLYEMLTGKRLFEGETVSDTFANLFSQTIDFDAVPAQIRPLLRRCLERDPKARLRDIGDSAFLLDVSPAPVTEAPAVAARTRRLPWLIAGVLAVLAAIFAGLWWHGKNVPLPLPHRFAVDAGGVKISPDGLWLLAANGDPGSLRVLAHDSVEWRTLPGSESPSSLFWSPDSSAVGFVAGGRLRTVGVDGSGLRDLAPAPEVHGGAWYGGVSDGVILFSSEGRLHRFDLASRKLSDVAVPLTSDEQAVLPEFLPEGERFLFERGTAKGLSGASTETAVYVASLADPGAAKVLIQAARQPLFARHTHSGEWYLFYADGTAQLDGFSVYAGPVNPRTGQFSAKPVRVLSNPAQSASTGALIFEVGGQGMIAWRKANSSLPIWHLRWFDHNGNVLSAVGQAGTYQSMALSPDERQVATHQGYPSTDIWVYNLSTGSGARFATGSGSTSYPFWSPDGAFLYYTQQKETAFSIFRRSADGGVPEEVAQTPVRLVVCAITADKQNLIMVGPNGGGVYRLNLSAFPRTLETLIQGEKVRTAMSVVLTRDQRWLLVETRGGALVYSYPRPEKDPVSIVSAPTRAFLSADGKALYGMATPNGGRLLVFPLMEAAGGRGLRLGPVSQLFPIATNSRVSSTVAAVTRDGSRFLAISGDASEELKAQVLTDWSTLLTHAQ